ncbi:serine/arginine-rich splicing factor RS2Z32-like [Hevea brasiliensis]|uniref:serine/arginine-rich splicing factor RS2Z32-like n=1 Tax=Hevea brasiliensis TaxID=3981 RepID=UPI0025FEE127|nr:serine/arginine-rich splicing factor RS2Z32-like [Hevea brasiliensis]
MPQFPAQFAQRDGLRCFQRNVKEKVEKLEKDKGEKSVEQSSGATSGKKKKFSGPSRGRGGRFGRGRFSGQRPPRSGQQSSRGSHSARPCETCGKIHGGECYWATGACFNCGGKGHIAKDCTSAPRYGPAPTTAEGSIQSPAPRGSQSFGRGRGRGRGTTSGSQGTVGQSAQGSASTRIYAMKQREEAETSDVVADTETRGAAD